MMDNCSFMMDNWEFKIDTRRFNPGNRTLKIASQPPKATCCIHHLNHKLERKIRIMQTGMTKRQKTIMSDTRELAHQVKTEPDFVEAMAEHGYDEASWTQFFELIDAADGAATARVDAEADKLGGTNTLHQKRDAVWRLASRLMSICYVIFKGQTDLLIRMGLHRSRRQDGSTGSYHPEIHRGTKIEILIPWLRNLFAVPQAHPEMAAVLARNGFPAERLAECSAAVEDLAETVHRRDQAAIFFSEACLKRNGAFSALATWLHCAQRTKADIEQDERRAMENGSPPGLGL
jgi:hypothetical protein